MFNLAYIKEKWRHVGFQKYFRNTGWMFGARIINILISLVVSAIVTRYLGPERYGLISYTVSFVGLFAFLSGFSVDQVIYQLLIKKPEQEREIIGTTLVVKFISGVVAYVCSLIIVFLFPHEKIIRYMVVIIALPYLFSGFNVFSVVFYSKVEAKVPSLLGMVTVIILTIFKLLVVYFNGGVIIFSLIFVIDPLLSQLLVFYMYYNKYKISGIKINVELIKEIFKTSLPLMFSSVFILIYSRIDQVMIKHMMDNSSVGIYGTMIGLAESWYFVPTMITNSVLPSIINSFTHKTNQYNKRLILLTSFLIIISLFICLAITLLAKIFVSILYGQAFISGVFSLQIYVWAGIGIAIFAVLSQHLINKNLSSIILYSSIIGMVANVIINLILIPKYGIEGAAIATLISYSLVPISVFMFPKAIKSLK